MPFGMVGWTGLWMRKILEFEDRSTGRDNLGANMGRPTVTSGGLFTIGNSQCAAERLLLGKFLELQARQALAHSVGVASTRSIAALLPRDLGPNDSSYLHQIWNGPHLIWAYM